MRDRPPTTLLLVLLFAIASLQGATLAQSFDEEGYEKAIAAIRCDCGCHPQSFKDCACPHAQKMRNSIRAMVQSGKSGDEVIAEFVAEQGEQALIVPPATRPFNLLVWIGPLIGLVLALGGMVLLLRRWTGRPASLAETAVAAPDSPDAVYLARLQRELEEFD